MTDPIYEFADGMLIDLRSVAVVEPLEGNGFDKKFHIVTHFGKRLAISEKNAKRSDFVDRWKHLMACQANPMWRVEL